MDASLKELERLSQASLRKFYNTTSWEKHHFALSCWLQRQRQRKKSTATLPTMNSEAAMPQTNDWMVCSTCPSPMQRNIHGDTELHRLLMTNAPVDVIRSQLQQLKECMDLCRQSTQSKALAQAQAQAQAAACPQDDTPDAIQTRSFTTNVHGVSPLHVALHRNAYDLESIVAALLEFDPSQCAVPMTTGFYPIHVMCAYNRTLNDRVFQTILDAAPHAILHEDVHGDNALSLLWKNVMRFGWAITAEQGSQTFHHVFSMARGTSSWMNVITPNQFLQYAVQLIASSRQKHPQNVTFHDICGTPRCPPLLVRLLLLHLHECGDAMHIEGDVYEVDDAHDRLPLHHAAQSPAVAHSDIVPIVELLLEAYPHGSHICDASGRLPLHYAMVNDTIGQRTIEALVKSYPESLRMPDPVTGLYPFMLVASKSSDANGDGGCIECGMRSIDLEDSAHALHAESTTSATTIAVPSSATTYVAVAQANPQETKDDRHNVLDMCFRLLKDCPDPMIEIVAMA